MNKDELGYDPTNVTSIVEYAQRLVGHTLRDFVYVEELAEVGNNKGSYGNAIQEHYFYIKPNSDPHPDFKEAHLELKATPVKRNAKGQFVAKERLVFSKIDYCSVVNEDFEHSRFLEKACDVLLVTYFHDKDKAPLDYEIEAVAHWGLPEEDLPQIKEDWETVVNKVRAGHAESISSSDTLYLEAATKGGTAKDRSTQPFSDVPAKPRAWALKASYMTAVQRKVIDSMKSIPRFEGEETLGLLELVRARFAPYFGLTPGELAARFDLSTNRKNLCACITRRILGVGDADAIEEFEKAGIASNTIKTIRLKRNGRPREGTVLNRIDYYDLCSTPFEQSEFFRWLIARYLLVLYRMDTEGDYRLDDICFWQMPESDFSEAKRCYEQMRANVRRGRADINVRIRENRCCHVRPRANDGTDTRPQPYGPPVVKKSFWLNPGYMQGEIERVLRS